MHISIHKFEVSLSLMASFAFFSSSIRNLERDGWTFSWILLFIFGFCFLFSVSFFLFCLCFEKTFSLKLWVVNLIILDGLSFFMLPTGWTLSMCFMNSPSSSLASLVIAKMALLLSSSFISSFLGFWRPVTIMHNLQEYWSASSSCWDNIVLTFLTTASSPSIAETVASSLPNLSKNSSMIFCCFWIMFNSFASLVCCYISMVDGCFWWEIGFAVTLLTLPGVIFLWFLWFLVMMKS